jgi:uncharacterized membrane protein/chemotaxis protein histidine kinase CheA
MDEILQQVARARRRLSIELFLERLWRCWLVSFVVAALAVAAPKVLPIAGLPAAWSAWWLGGAAVAGVLASLVWTWRRGRSALDAAIEIDRRFGLKERIASSLSLDGESAASPAGQALMADAQRAARRIAIDDKFRVQWGTRPWLPLGPMLAAVVLAAFVDNREAKSLVPMATTVSQQQLDNTAEAVKKKLADQRKEAAKKGLKDAAEMLFDLEKQAEKLAIPENRDRKQALVKLNDLKKELDKRRQSLGADEQLRRQLSSMKDLSKGPADKMVEAMKQGDWQQARKELAKLQQQMAAGKMSEADKKQLQKQIAQLQQKISDAAAQRQQAMEDLQKQIAEQKKNGNLAQAGKLQEKLDKLASQSQQAQQLDKMASKLAQAQKAMQQGDSKAAAQAMQEMLSQLDQMDKDAQEGAMLDMAMAELESAKSSMGCKECEGKGCSMCQGTRFNPNGIPGKGMGQGLGMGPRPEEKTGANFRDSQVKQKTGRGSAVIAGEADGPTIRGEVQAQVTAEMEAEGSKAADPMVIEQLPKTQRENAEDFFNRLREGD